MNIKKLMLKNLTQYQEDIINKQFPKSEHSQNMNAEQLILFKKAIENI